jgi:HrpA-like RNA helicase
MLGNRASLSSDHLTFSFSTLQMKLPIYQLRKTLFRAFNKSNIVLLSAETGSGKSTTVPLLLIQEYSKCSGDWLVLCSQTRRSAAKQLAYSVSSMMPGAPVGYQIRYEKKILGLNESILYITEGFYLNFKFFRYTAQ